MQLLQMKFVCIYLCIKFASASPRVCNCILVRDCAPFTRLLLNHRPETRADVFAVVHAAGCGYQGLEPLACCPTQRPSESESHSFGQTTSRAVRFAPPSHDRWIWDSSSNAGFNPFLNIPFNPYATEMSLHDYRDFESQRNSPLPLDFGYDGPQHHFQYHISHDHVPDWPPPPQRVPKDRPIVFPGDLRFQMSIEKKNNQLPAPAMVPTAATLSPTPAVATTTPNPPAAPTPAPARMNAPDCGISVKVRVLGGEEVTPGQYPWLARIGYRNRTNNRLSYRCSGSLISNNYILTAAHCVVNLVNDLELSHVRIGDDAASSKDCANCSAPNLFAINRLLVHPNYDQPRYANDIALLGINNTRSNFTAICLPLNNSAGLADSLIGQMGVAAGWSTANVENTNSSTVRFIRLPIVNTTSCAITYASFSENFQQPIVITPSHLCAQGQPMNDVCRGDSGGPFMDDGTSGLISDNGRHSLLGIVAFGPTLCGVSSIPGVYTRVSAYLDWIFKGLSA